MIRKKLALLPINIMLKSTREAVSEREGRAIAG
jgi:hypothetical protein